MANVADRVYDLIESAVNSADVRLWDVQFLKEGASYYLRVFIDKDGGVCIDDCTCVSHLIDPIIDDADPIDKAYYLEVCSSGLERTLSREWHFKSSLGKKIKVKLYKAYGGSKELHGTLKDYDGGILVSTDDGDVYFEKGDFSRVQLDDANF